MNPKLSFQRVLYVNYYADFEFRIENFLIWICIVVVYKDM